MNGKWIGIAIGSSIAIIPALISPVQARSIALTQLFPALVGVQLTPAQELQLEQLTEQTLPQIKRGLSPDRLTHFEAALNAGKPVRAALLDLDLSTNQQLKLTRELNSVKTKLSQILTPKQQQQVMQNALAIQSK